MSFKIPCQKCSEEITFIGDKFLSIWRKKAFPRGFILITYNNEEIGLSVNFEDFVEALKEEVGSVTWTFKKATFEKQLDEAITRVVSKIKEEGVKVIK